LTSVNSWVTEAVKHVQQSSIFLTATGAFVTMMKNIPSVISVS
jgi:hypothetical protein